MGSRSRSTDASISTRAFFWEVGVKKLSTVLFFDMLVGTYTKLISKTDCCVIAKDIIVIAQSGC